MCWPADRCGPVRRLAIAAALGLLGLGGCATPAGQTAAPRMSRPEQVVLHNRALELLLRAAESDLDIVTCNALEALVEVAPREGLPAFQRAVLAESPVVRFAGFIALGTVRDCDSWDAMRAGLADPNTPVRLAAAFAAYRCGREGAARVLTQALANGPDEAMRAEAATLIGRLGEPRARKWLQAALQMPGNAKSNRVALALYGALARLGDEDAIRRLVLYSRGNTAERVESLLILTTLDLHEVREDLLFALAGPEEEYLEARLLAARGLGRLGFKDGYDLAARMLTYTDPNTNPTPDNPSRTFAVRSLAIHALAEIRDRRALPALAEVAADQSDPRLQVAASYAICRILGAEVR